MATRKICDTCNKMPALTYRYFISRKMDAAGSVDNQYGEIDLCFEHGIAMLNELDSLVPNNTEKEKIIGLYRRIEQ